MNLNTSRIALCSIVSCTLVQCAFAQSGTALPAAPTTPTLANASGSQTTVSGAISQLNYNREGEIDGFTLDGGTLVNLPPGIGTRLESSVHGGDAVQVTGIANTSLQGLKQFDAFAVQDKTSGQSFNWQVNSATAISAMTGRIKFLNYDRRGAINGFLLDNGTLVCLPPIDPASTTRPQIGASASVSGDRRETISGRKVVDAQTLTLNGEPFTIAQAPAPPPAGGPAGPPPPAPPVNGDMAPPPPPADAPGHNAC